MAVERGGAGAGEPIVVCGKLTKIFRDFWMRNRVRAVEDVDLEVRRGEVLGLLGPNGSGKSTTIKMILGLLRPTSGRIAVFGKRPDDVAIKKRIGYLPEESYLYRFLDARETLDYYGRLFHLERRQRMRRVEMLLEMVGLEAAQRRPVGEYSKGMQRRIGLAQALINDPEFLILDEPTTGLDPIGTRQIKDLILELGRRGKTVLLCSHLLADVEDVCDRIAIMYGGKVRLEGTVDELLVRQDVMTIQTGLLDDRTIEQVESVLTRHGRSIERVERPRQKLESLFLEIVQRAQAEGAATSGARSGGKIAEFLTTDEQADQGQALIDRLAGSVEEPASPAQEVAAPQPQAPSPATEVIESLAVPKPTEAPPRAKGPHSPAKDQDVDKSVIDRLLDPGSGPGKAE
ncbi:MAG: ATP-binding cassette domain-containing protein [Phycisphaeraceae bacterium]|nr:ATP-binding cassette domain-containing protein [Phycisphaeraceae bacterium]